MVYKIGRIFRKVMGNLKKDTFSKGSMSYFKVWIKSKETALTNRPIKTYSTKDRCSEERADQCKCL